MKPKHVLIGIVMLLACGCQTMSNTDAGVLGGGALGAGTGALIGSATGDTGAGALLGGVIGAIAGGVTGSAVDRAEMRAENRAVQRIRYEQAVQASQRPPVTIADVINMSNKGVADSVIIQQIQSTGSVFNLRPDDVIMLSQYHVSPAVISEMQRRRGQPAVAVQQPPPVVQRQVIIEEYPPPPPVSFGFGWGYGWGPRPCCRRGWW